MNKRSDLLCSDTISQRLLEAVEAGFACGVGRVEGLCRFAVEVQGLSVLGWLAGQKADVKVYWSDRDGKLEVAGTGQADVVSEDRYADLSQAVNAIERSIGIGSGSIMYYGGVCFDEQTEPWDSFGRFRFVVPEFELRREGERTTIAFNALCSPSDTAESVKQRLLGAFDRLKFDQSGGCIRPVVSERVDVPNKNRWDSMVKLAVSEMPSRGVSKIVLSRKAILETDDDVDAVTLLSETVRYSSNTFDFCFQFDQGDAFIGCSPERLFSRKGNAIFSEAIAGTCPAGKSESERLHHQDELRRSAKEVEEHGYVDENVKADLAKICKTIEVTEERDVLSLGYVQHFCSRFAGTLREDVGTYDIIEALHPTAAVNGFPKAAAMEEIRRCEEFSRGWYAGPVGWIGGEASEFAVGIRSGRVEGRRISLFAGAGIVKASDADSEWDETENKLSLFGDVINSEH